MILEGDAAQLEWRCAAFLSQDQVMIDEIRNGIDAHGYTLEHFFGGQGKRVDAKVFNFGMIYGRSEYGYVRDANMPKFSLAKWRKIIKQFYEKYNGLYRWHQQNIQLVNSQGYLINPTGRILNFPLIIKKDGSKGYHEPHIKNYPVQSFATADLIPLVGVQIWRMIKKEGIRALAIQIVHDSFLCDVPTESIKMVAEIMVHYFRLLPETVKNYFGFELNVPMDCEVKIGENWSKMETYNIA